MRPKNEYACLAIRRSRNEFLTIHHALKKEHLWRFPGGKLDAGETPRAAAIRECREEIGILPLNLVEIGTDTTYVDGAHWTGHFFLVTRWQGDIVLKEPHKHDCYSWYTPERLQELDSHPEAEMAAKACDEGFGFYRPARVVVPPCSRPFPHICKVNGYCNGWPKEVVVA